MLEFLNRAPTRNNKKGETNLKCDQNIESKKTPRKCDVTCVIPTNIFLNKMLRNFSTAITKGTEIN